MISALFSGGLIGLVGDALKLAIIIAIGLALWIATPGYADAAPLRPHLDIEAGQSVLRIILIGVGVIALVIAFAPESDPK